MNRKWDIRFLSLAHAIGQWSKDPSTKVGSVITTSGNVMISSGYNGFPQRTDDNEELYLDRPRKYKRIIHAEKNAMMFAKRDLDGCTLYCTLPPCTQCAAMVIQTGIKRVVTIEPTETQFERWGADMTESLQMFSEAVVAFDQYKKIDIIESIVNTLEGTVKQV